jgi:prepilin-type N-terminal cleavage/methylation domain-containing protein
MHTQFEKSSRAFTLVEVLAALVLIGVVLPVAMRGVSIAMQTAQHARHIAEAGELAQLKLQEFITLRDVTLFNTSGDFGENRKEYRWVSNALLRDGSSYDVTITVYFQERGREQAITLSTIIYPESTTGATQ